MDIRVWKLKNCRAPAAVLAALGLNACSRPDVVDADLPPPVESREVHVLTWAEYIPPDLMQKFEERTGFRIVEHAYDDSERMTSELKASNHKYDLVIAISNMIPRLHKMSLVQKLDQSALRGLENLDPRFLSLATDPDNEYSLPYFWGSTLIAYRADKIEQPVQSLELLFDERYQDKILMLSDYQELFAVPHLRTGRPLNSFAEEDLVNASAMLAEQARSNGARLAANADICDALKAGDAWIGMCYSGDAAWIAESEPNISYFIPHEGAPLWIDSLLMTRDCKNPEGVHELINFLLEPEICAENANTQWYAPPNLAAMKLLDEELLADPAVFPSKEVMARCEFLVPASDEVLVRMSQLMREIVSATNEPVASTP